MLVLLGNTAPILADGAPAVTTINVPASYTFEVPDDLARFAVEIVQHLLQTDGATRLPGQEALLSVMAAWAAQSNAKPGWVWSDNHDFARVISMLYGCPVGIPDDLEATHFTMAGPPGVGV